MSERIYGSRYIHVCNSGTTIKVRANVLEKEGRADLVVHMGAFGAITSEMVCSGNDYDGLTSAQLRDISRMFAEAADNLDRGETIGDGLNSIVPADGRERVEAHASGDLAAALAAAETQQ